VLFQVGCKIVSVEPITPLGILQVLPVEDLKHLPTDSAPLACVGSQLSAKRRNRIIACKGLIVPAFNG
jgi:hypothetical protein